MNFPNDPQYTTPGEPIAGEPLIDPPGDGQAMDAPPVQYIEPAPNDSLTGAEVVVSSTDDSLTGAEVVVSSTDEGEGGEGRPSDEATEQGGGKLKAAAVVAGVAALANKVRQEAPKKVRQVRQKRAAGRCVILTEADGRYLVIGPYRSEDAARQDVFKVGGAPHVAELVSPAAFFTPSTP